jgi:ribonuclease R
MIRLSDLKDDFYEFDESNFCVIGINNRRVITLGDQIYVKVINTDIDRRVIDLEFADSNEPTD